MKPLLCVLGAVVCCCGSWMTAAEPVKPFFLDVPAGLDLYVPTPSGNRLSLAKVELGQKLFFDPGLSVDRSVACSTCHDPQHAFTIAEAFANGVNGQRTTRNPPALLNRAYGEAFFWDGRASSLEEQVLQPIQNPQEMYLSLDELIDRLGQDNDYRNDFQLAFGRDPNAKDVARALASYVRSLLVGDSPYDRYVLGDPESLSPNAKRGLKLFRGKANCWSCHSGPNLTDEDFHNTGVAWHGDELKDVGRYAVTGDDVHRGAFKTPTLRQVSLTGPYMHDGSLTSLAEVIERYDQGGIPNPYLDREIRPLNLSDEEKRDLQSFLESLTGEIGFESTQAKLDPGRASIN